jgi:hypothetical protein
MNMKFCPNYGCVAYGRVVYTHATRCVFCRWDLKPPRMKSETLEPAPSSAKSPEIWATPEQEKDAIVEVRVPAETRGPRRAPLRHSA